MYNKIIIDIAAKFVKQQEELSNTIQAINHIRLHKRIVLICELLDLNGKIPIKAYNNIIE